MSSVQDNKGIEQSGGPSLAVGTLPSNPLGLSPKASPSNPNIGEREVRNSLEESNTARLSTTNSRAQEVPSTVPSLVYPPQAVLNPPSSASAQQNTRHRSGSLPAATFTSAPMPYGWTPPAPPLTSSPMTYGESLPAPTYSSSPAYGSSYAPQPVLVGKASSPNISISNTPRSSINYQPGYAFVPYQHPPNSYSTRNLVHGPEPSSSSMQAQATTSRSGHGGSLRPPNRTNSAEGRPRSGSIKTLDRSGFVANDPFRRTSNQTLVEDITDTITYDDIPVYEPAFTPTPSLYDSPYSLPYNQFPPPHQFPSHFPPTSQQPQSHFPITPHQSHSSLPSAVWPQTIGQHQTIPISQYQPALPVAASPGQFQVPFPGQMVMIRPSFPNSTQPPIGHGTVADTPTQTAPHGPPDIPPLPARQDSTAIPNRPSDAEHIGEHSQPVWFADETQGAPDLNDPRPQYYPFHDIELPFDLTVIPKPSIWSRISDCLLWPFDYNNPAKPKPPQSTSIFDSKDFAKYGKLASQFLLDSLPRWTYQYLLLYLPALYFGRVAHIFEEADLGLPEIKRMAFQTAAEGKFDFYTLEKMPQYRRLRATWQSFIEDVMREWKTFNIISVLLLSAILTILQISAAADDAVARYSALASLICALISLLFGCMYIIRFGRMRKAHKAAEWALEAKKTKTHIFWNVWVLLAMPLVWLSWSLLLFLLCNMSFVWRASPSTSEPQPPPPYCVLLAIRILLTLILAVGFSYGVLILSTFRRYGEPMDKAWKKRVDGWLEEHPIVLPMTPPIYYNSPYYPPRGYDLHPDYGTSHTLDRPFSPPSLSRPVGPAPYTDYYGYTTDTEGRPYSLRSRSGSPESDYVPSISDNGSDYVTWYNTMQNVYVPRDDTTASQQTNAEAPYANQETSLPISRKSRARRARKRTPPNAPPSQSLPTFPTTPFTPPRPTITHSQTEPYVGLEDDDSPHVHFRSPPASSGGSNIMSPTSAHHVSLMSDQPDLSRHPVGSEPPGLSRSESIESLYPYNYYDTSGQFG